MIGWLWHALGFDYGLPYGRLGIYNAWSGFGSDIGELAIIGGMVTIVRKHRCHVHKCWRLGRHPVAGTTHIACRKHHPDGHLTHQQLLDAHQAAREAHPGRGADGRYASKRTTAKMLRTRIDGDLRRGRREVVADSMAADQGRGANRDRPGAYHHADILPAAVRRPPGDRAGPDGPRGGQPRYGAAIRAIVHSRAWSWVVFAVIAAIWAAGIVLAFIAAGDSARGPG